ncbi:ER membrane protein complex subunit 8-like [Hydractinia symbiolongicarpus]|uniref:ER membrane protein complex subunit 8-like n=1 Tax=Hydractinia symbiolongicarpus TaxID=13093 RepID=UPI00254BC415|nr:ER membrane protein complex subunit 8-like [Hydractinia symbiolongicarpus]
MKTTVSPRSYAKVLLHACKYPHKAVNGILLAEESSKNSDTIQIVDAVPLFHQCLGLAAMLEIALTQIDTYCRRHKLQIMGYYQANEHVDDNSPDLISYKIAEKINENTPNSILMMVNNQRMDAECKKTALDLYTMSDGKWTISSDCQLIGGDASLALMSELITGKTSQSLVDFDNHLDDISLDWLNITINKMVELAPS